MHKRIYKFDNLKFLLILFVVIGHFADLYVSTYRSMKIIFIFLYSFHMPLFLFITGIFTKKIKTYKDIPVKKIIFYIFLIYFMKISMFYCAKYFNLETSFYLLQGTEAYWYLSVIILYILISPIINKIKFPYLLTFSIILGLFVGYDSTINDYLYLSRAIVFFPFYLLGYYYKDKSEKIIELTNKKTLKILSIIILITFIYICTNNLDYIYKYRMLFTGKNPYSYFAEFICTHKHRLLTYSISTIVGFSIMCLIPSRKIRIISNLGKRTLQVYVFHQTFIILFQGLGLFDYLEKTFKENFQYIYILTAIILTFFLSLRMFTKIINYLNKNMFIDEKS